MLLLLFVVDLNLIFMFISLQLNFHLTYSSRECELLSACLFIFNISHVMCTADLRRYRRQTLAFNFHFHFIVFIQDYMDNGNAKTFRLIHASVKIPGKRGSKPAQHCMYSMLCIFPVVNSMVLPLSLFSN